GAAAGHARAEVVPGLAQHANETAGHVFAAVVARAFHHGMGTGVAHRETLTRGTGGEQLAAGGAVQAGIADDGRVLRAEGAVLRRRDHQLAAGPTLAHVIVGIAFQVEVKATGIPYTEALPGCALETEGDGCVLHALVAMHAGDLAGHAAADGAVAVADLQFELAAALGVDGFARQA